MPTSQGTIIAASTGPTPPIEVTAASAQMVKNTKYIANRATRVTLTLPAPGDISMGDQILVRGKGAGGWKVAQNAGQTVRGASNSTTGAAGYVQSQSPTDTVALEVVDATATTTDFLIISNRGTLDIA